MEIYTWLFTRKNTYIICHLCGHHSPGYSSKTYRSFQSVWRDRPHMWNNIKPGKMVYTTKSSKVYVQNCMEWDTSVLMFREEEDQSQKLKVWLGDTCPRNVLTIPSKSIQASQGTHRVCTRPLISTLEIGCFLVSGNTLAHFNKTKVKFLALKSHYQKMQEYGVSWPGFKSQLCYFSNCGSWAMSSQRMESRNPIVENGVGANWPPT